MPGPPPPPPGPPPPPMMGPPKKATPFGGGGGGGDMRNALLGQIQKGAKLKKVTTVDKSGPLIAGKVADATPSPSRSRGAPVVSSNKSSPDSSTSSPSKRPPGGFTNLTDELQFKLTLKKNKNSPVKESPDTTSPALSTTSNTPSIPFIKPSVIPSHHSTTTLSHAPSIPDAIPNKSSLFNKTSTSSSPLPGGAPTVLNQPKVINHGKPNLAPRPPPQLKLVGSGNNSNSNDNNGDSNRKAVARHQSMKSPRSPPIGLTPTGPFNSDNHFGTIRMTPGNQQQLKEALNLHAPLQKPSAQRPTNKPPPPPVPNRLPGTNLTNNHAKSTNALNLSASANDTSLSAPRRIPNSGSSNNISSMDRSIDVSDASAPPLPPHRISSQGRAPPTPVLAVPSIQAPPEVPRRHSSMRNSIENGANGKYPSSNQPITRLVVDLESRYSLLFHSVSDFPVPKPFMNLEKSYPSKAVRQANGI